MSLNLSNRSIDQNNIKGKYIESVLNGPLDRIWESLEVFNWECNGTGMTKDLIA